MVSKIHYLITEWNVDMFDLDWLLERQKLFEKFTLPSVESQINKDFRWVLVSDERTPDVFKKILNSYPAEVLYFNFENYIWGAPKLPTEIMQRSVDLEYIKNVLVDYIGTPNVNYIITSRLDNDDAISIDHIDRIQKYARDLWKGNKFWLNLTRGYKWCDGFVYPKNSQSNPFISFVEFPQDIQTTYQVCHTEARKTPYEFVTIREGSPTWLQVIHHQNLLNKLMRTKGKDSDSTIKELFKINI